MVDIKDKNVDEDEAAKRAAYEKEIEGLSPEERAEFDLGTETPLTNLMVRRPCCILGIGFAIMIVISMISFYFEWLLPQTQTDRDFMVWGDPYVNDFDKSYLVGRDLFIISDREIPLQSYKVPEWTIMAVYSLPEGST